MTKDVSVPRGVTEAKAIIAKLEKRPTSIGLTAKITKSIPAGKRIAYIQLNLPTTIELTPFLSAAAKTLGWELKTIQAGLTPETFKAAFAQAVREKPDAVFSAGIPDTVVSLEIDQLKDAGIPVVFLGAPNPPIPGKGIIANLYGIKEHINAGRHQADWVIADSNGKADAVFFNLSTLPVLDAVRVGFQQEMRRLCRTTCRYKVVDTQPTDIGQTLPTQIVGYLRANPKTKYVVLTTSDQALGVPGALADAGFGKSEIRIIADNAGAPDRVNIATGNYAAANTTFPKHEAMWRVMDVLARHFAGLPVARSVNAPYPDWILTKRNVKQWPGPPEATWPLAATYQSQYKALWGKK